MIHGTMYSSREIGDCSLKRLNNRGSPLGQLGLEAREMTPWISVSSIHLPLSAPKYHTERGSNIAPNCISYFLLWILLDFDSLPTE